MKLTDDVTVAGLINPKKYPVLYKAVRRAVTALRTGFWLFFVGAIVWGLGGEIWKQIPHTKSVSITAQSNWFVGETKACGAVVLRNEDLPNLLRCDDGPEHVIDVRFDGFPDHKKDDYFWWDCVRTDSSFSCKLKKQNQR